MNLLLRWIGLMIKVEVAMCGHMSAEEGKPVVAYPTPPE